MRRPFEYHESYVAEVLPNARTTSASGALTDKADARSVVSLDWHFFVECKSSEKQSISVKKSVWEKVREEAYAKSAGARPALALRLHGGTSRPEMDLLALDINDMAELIHELAELKEEIGSMYTVDFKGGPMDGQRKRFGTWIPEIRMGGGIYTPTEEQERDRDGQPYNDVVEYTWNI